MVAPYEAGPTEDSIAREMARLTFDKVTTIAEVQHVHSRRLATIESKLDDHSAMHKSHSAMLKEHSVRLATIESKLDDHSTTLKEHGVMLRQILARLPEPPAA